MTDELTARLRAQVDAEHWEAFKFRHDAVWPVEMLASLFGRHPSDPIIHHIARHDPARVLREVAAKRRILELAGEADDIEAALADETARRPPKPGELSIGDHIRAALAAVYVDA